MDLENLEKVLVNEPEYRLKQAKEAVFKNFISDWSEATFFTKDLRDKLNKECPLGIDADVSVSKKEDSVKARITVKNGHKIETVLMRHEDGRNTVCVSCQVGCPLGCLFCATGKMGFTRNLSTDEIVEQVVFFDRYLKLEDSIVAQGFGLQASQSKNSEAYYGTKSAEGFLRRRSPRQNIVADGNSPIQGINLKPENLHVTNVTFMGMGEPFLNYENVWGAVKIFNDAKYFNIGVRSISISTAGIIEGIERVSEESLHVNLAISLHAPNDKLRSSLMPIDKRYPLEDVLRAVAEYVKKTNRKVMFEYVLIKGVNDSDDHAKELAKIMNPVRGHQTSRGLQRNQASNGVNKNLYFVNLILYNETAGIKFKPSDTKRVEAFKAILEKLKIRYTQRYRFGDDINAACGQFTTNK